MSDDIQETGLDNTGATTNSSSSAKGPLAADLAETLRLIEQKRAAGRAEMEQRGMSWREPPKRLHEPGASHPTKPMRAKPEAPHFSCETCRDQGSLGYSWNARPCTCAAGERWQAEQVQGRESARGSRSVQAARGAGAAAHAPRAAGHAPIAAHDKETYPRQGNQKALRKVLDYVEQGTYQQRGLGLVGPVGCGKMSLIVTAYKLVAPRLLEYPSASAASIQFLSVIDLFDRLRNSFDEDKRTGEPRSRSALQAIYRSAPAGAR